MDLIEDIGPILGIVAFLGFAILALLIVLQAREVRRLREWAGRAPERAREADEADRAAAEERGELIEEEEKRRPGRMGAFRERIANAVGPSWAALDRRSPVDPRWFLVGASRRADRSGHRHERVRPDRRRRAGGKRGDPARRQGRRRRRRAGEGPATHGHRAERDPDRRPGGAGAGRDRALPTMSQTRSSSRPVSRLTYAPTRLPGTRSR